MLSVVSTTTCIFPLVLFLKERVQEVLFFMEEKWSQRGPSHIKSTVAIGPKEN